jgi:hypothetical protein
MLMVLLIMMGLGLVLGFLTAAWLVRGADADRKPVRNHDEASGSARRR